MGNNIITFRPGGVVKLQVAYLFGNETFSVENLRRKVEIPIEGAYY